MDPLTRLSWHVLLQALADAPREQYSPESVIEGLRPWASIVHLPLKPLRETYMAARAGLMDAPRLRDTPRSDDGARKRLQEMGLPMPREWDDAKWWYRPARKGGGRKTWAENISALR